ncbi:hypothetical protein HZH68_005167 [Vespula germanica]|uniref:Uncharacterized protein n=1 Tax=Vespula germanica TaxID=30212 RepID=A0A834NFR6_VESGE|nr:hypothetical protein HZH68_005167 [Vespula germanica]
MEHLGIVCDGTVVDTSMFLVLLCPQTPQTQPFAQLISSNCNLVDERGNKDSSRISKRLDVYARHPSLCVSICVSFSMEENINAKLELQVKLEILTIKARKNLSEEYKDVVHTDNIRAQEVARANVPPPGRIVIGTHESTKGGMISRATFSRSRYVIGYHESRRGGMSQQATSRFARGLDENTRGDKFSRASSRSRFATGLHENTRGGKFSRATSSTRGGTFSRATSRSVTGLHESTRGGMISRATSRYRFVTGLHESTRGGMISRATSRCHLDCNRSCKLRNVLESCNTESGCSQI